MDLSYARVTLFFVTLTSPSVTLTSPSVTVTHSHGMMTHNFGTMTLFTKLPIMESEACCHLWKVKEPLRLESEHRITLKLLCLTESTCLFWENYFQPSFEDWYCRLVFIRYPHVV